MKLIKTIAESVSSKQDLAYIPTLNSTKHWQFLLLTACLFPVSNLVFGNSTRVSNQDKPSGTFSILHTSDFHGRYAPLNVTKGNALAQNGDSGQVWQEFEHDGMAGGMAYLATEIEKIRKERGRENVLLVNSGDTFSDDLLGNLTKGEAMIKLMNELEFDLMALGNHDFDYGRERTKELQQIATFPLRGANVIDETTGNPFLGEPVLYKTINGIRIGLLTLANHNTHLTTNPDNVKGLKFTSGIDAARQYIPQMRRMADVVIVVSHEGKKVDEQMAKGVQGIDIIIGGHSHKYIHPAKKIGDTYMVQALSDGTVLGDLQVRVQRGKIAEVISQSHVLWNDRIVPHPQIQSLVSSLRAPYQKQLEEEVATLQEPVGRKYKSESPFDKLAGELLRKETGSQIAFLPGVGYGATLHKGPLTRERLYQLLPHSSTVVTMKLSGAQIMEILEQSATNNEPPDVMDGVGGLIQTAGLSWQIDYRQPSGKRVSRVKAGSQPIDTKRMYTVVTHSGMLSGLHKYSAFKTGTSIVKHTKKVNEVVESQLRMLKTISLPELGDIIVLGIKEE